MERNEVSVHEARVYATFLAEPGEWLTARDVSTKAKVAERTARAHCLKLVRLGVLDQAEVFPAHRYRLAGKGAQRNVGYHQRLTQVLEIFGLS